MNYIILNQSVQDDLAVLYKKEKEKYGLKIEFISYVYHKLTYNHSFMIYNREKIYHNQKSYLIIGKGCILVMLNDNSRFRNAFYAIKLFEAKDEEKHNTQLMQSFKLEGEWSLIRENKLKHANLINSPSIHSVLWKIHDSYNRRAEFEKEWNTWDRYNLKIKESIEQKEIKSKCNVLKTGIKNNEFHIWIDNANHAIDKYKVGEDIEVLLKKGTGRFQPLGKVTQVDRNKKWVAVLSEDEKFVKRYINSKDSITAMKIVDRKAKVRRKRQEDALRRVFDNRSVNKNLKKIIMNEFDYNVSDYEDVIDSQSVKGLFGANEIQKIAYQNALNSPDIYLIQGPPGTGKTTIITGMVKNILSRGMRVLVSSETHTAVDNVLERLDGEEILPIRLGNEDRISDGCKKYLLENISSHIINSTRNKINSFDNNELFNLDSLIKEEYESLDSILLELNQKIVEIEKGLPAISDYQKFWHELEKYEEDLLEVNMMYEKLVQEKSGLEELKEKKRELENQIQYNEELIRLSTLNQNGHSTFIFDKIKVDQSRLKNQKLKKELESVDKEFVEKTTVSLSEYNRKRKRVLRNREKLEEIIGKSASFNTKVFEIKEALKKIEEYNHRKEYEKQKVEEQILELKNSISHERNIWELRRKFRKRWIELLETKELKNEIENIYLKKANVVFATCSGIASSQNGIFSGMEYDYVIIDEAAKCNMLDLLIPLNKGRKMILVGDHRQLYPMIETENIDLSKDEIQMLREHILFKFLYETFIPDKYKIMLSRQYRMVKDISDFISLNFYNGVLKCEKTKENDEKVMFWIDCENSKEVYRTDNYSPENRVEANVIVDLLMMLDNKYMKGTTVGVITAYKTQEILIKEMMKDLELKNIDLECSTVDAFQGKEKHTIIFNLVRSKKLTDFLIDDNRINVAVSRAQEFLYVVGNAKLVQKKESKLLSLYHYIGKHGKIIKDLYMENII